MTRCTQCGLSPSECGAACQKGTKHRPAHRFPVVETLSERWRASLSLRSDSTHSVTIERLSGPTTFYLATSRDCREFAERVSNEPGVIEVQAGPLLQATNGPIR